MTTYKTERLIYRDVSKADIPFIQVYASDKELSKKTLNIPYPYPNDGAEQFFKATVKAEAAGLMKLFVMEKQDEFVGTIALTINNQENSAELGYWVAKPFWGLGLGTEAAHFICGFAFKKLGLNKLMASAQADNIGSKRILEKIGMHLTATTKKDRFRMGRWSDTVHYQLMSQDFNKTIVQ